MKTLIPGWKKSKTAGRVEIDTDVAKIAIVGSRIASTPGLGARMFTALADRSINIDCISTSEMKVSCIIAEKALDDAARAVHAEFFGQAVTSESDEGGPRRADREEGRRDRSAPPGPDARRRQPPATDGPRRA